MDRRPRSLVIDRALARACSRSARRALSGALVLFAASEASAGATFVVGPGESIQAAIAAAGRGDEILVLAGTYPGAIDLMGKAIALRGEGADSTVISAQSAGTAIVGAANGTTLSDFTVTGGGGNQGGGMLNVGASPTVERCVFLDNDAGFGGGMYNVGASPTVRDCRFEGNRALVGSGGGMLNNGSSPAVVRCDFVANASTTRSGGGVFNVDSSPSFEACRFVSNSAALDGGGLFCDDSSPLVVSSLFTANTASLGGALYTSYASSPAVVNCTFSSNAAASGGAIFTAFGSTPLVANSILWGDLPSEVEAFASTATVNWSIVEGGWSGAGSGNLDDDPLFVDADGPDDDVATALDNDFRLASLSPAIDAGDNTAVPGASDLDLDGLPRFVDDPTVLDTGIPDGVNPPIDRGAHELQAAPIPGDLDGDGTVGPDDIAFLYASWGACPPSPAACPADLDGDGMVGFSDLIALLFAWG